MPSCVALIGLFFFLLPILVVAFSDVDRLSNGRYITVVIGSLILGLLFIALDVFGL